MKERYRHFVDRAVLLAQGRAGLFFLGIFSFFESIIIPVPTDALLIPLSLARPKEWLRLSLIAVITSVAGGVATYIIGYIFYESLGQWLVDVLHLQNAFYVLQDSFAKNTFVTMLVSAFTFIPYKAVALAGGVFSAPLFSFIIASLLGRALRFVTGSYLSARFGPYMGKMIYQRFSWFVGGVMVFMLIMLILWGLLVETK